MRQFNLACIFSCSDIYLGEQDLDIILGTTFNYLCICLIFEDYNDLKHVIRLFIILNSLKSTTLDVDYFYFSISNEQSFILTELSLLANKLLKKLWKYQLLLCF